MSWIGDASIPRQGSIRPSGSKPKWWVSRTRPTLRGSENCRVGRVRETHHFAMIARADSPRIPLPLTPSAALPILPRHRRRGTFLRLSCAGMNPSSLHHIGPLAGHRTRFVTLAVCALAMFAHSAARADFPEMPSLNPFAKSPEPGTPEWWKKHQYTDATFDPSKGYSVPGVDGYFDEKGRRLDRAPVDGSVATPTPRLDGKD